MNPNITLKLDYQKDEVVSAQQIEMVESYRFRIMIVIVVLGFLGAVAQQIKFGIEAHGIPTTWWGPLLMLLAILVGFVFAYYYKPANDFRINPIWRNTFQLQLSSEQFSIIPEGELKGFELPWARVKSVLENEKVFLLIWDWKQGYALYAILPKRILQSQEKYLRDNLSHILGRAWKVRK